MASLELGSVRLVAPPVAVARTRKRAQCLQSAGVKVEQSASLMQLHSTLLSSVVRQEKPNQGGGWEVGVGKGGLLKS